MLEAIAGDGHIDIPSWFFIGAIVIVLVSGGIAVVAMVLRYRQRWGKNGTGL